MRHLKEGRKLGRTSSHRRALLRNMVSSLLEHEKIETTDAKAKELRKIADKMISWGKRGDVHARRQVLKIIGSKKIVQKLFNTIAPRFEKRKGGYTRILKVRRRKGDNAPLSIIELIPLEEFKSTVRGSKKAKGESAKESMSTK
jgi:large subunit ribosomal protein L17